MKFLLLSIQIFSFILVCLSQNFSSKCENVLNGCKIREYYFDQGKFILKYLICHKLSKSAGFGSEMIEDLGYCQFLETSFFFQLYHSEILDSRFDIIKIINFSRRIFDHRRIFITNLKGFALDYFQNNSHIIPNIENSFNLIAHSSKLQFFLNGSLVNGCHGLHLNNVNSIFQLIPEKNRIFLRKPQLKHSICSIVFKNANFKLMLVSHQINTFYKKNVLSFDDHESFKHVDLGIRVNQVIFEKFINLDLDETVLNKQVFVSIYDLYLDGRLSTIQQGLLKSFKKLKRLELSVQHWKRFVHKQGIRWIEELNSDLIVNYEPNKMVDIKNKNIMYFELCLKNTREKGLYTDYFRYDSVFPNEDICLYKKFPFKQYIILIFNSELALGNMTCTYSWIIQYVEWFPDSGFVIKTYKRMINSAKGKLI